MNYTRKIAVFVSHIFGRYQTLLCQGILEEAERRGYHTDIFTSNDDPSLEKYNLLEDSILLLPHYEEYDGVIFASGTYPSFDLRNKINAALKQRCSCPVLEVNSQEFDFPIIYMDNNAPFGALTQHLITVHGCRRICYLGCEPEAFFSEPRRQQVANICARHMLPFTEAQYCSTDYDTEHIQKALTQLLSAPLRPDAIVCYNDRFAQTVILLLQNQGLKVPEDILVTGCDDLDSARNASPSMTTISFPMLKTGMAAVQLLEKAIRGETLPRRTVIPSHPLYRSSCGCSAADASHSYQYMYKLIQQIDRMENSMLNVINMSYALQSVTDPEDGMDFLEDYISSIDYCQGFYLCLYPHWDLPQRQLDAPLTSSDMLELKFAIKNKRRLPSCVYKSTDLLPPFITKNASSFLYSTLHSEDRTFGFIAMSFLEDRLFYPVQFLSWLNAVSSMLQNIAASRHVGILTSQLEQIYLKDDLTGLYNYPGFKERSLPILKECAQQGRKLSCFCFRLDSLAEVKQTYGKKEGYFLLEILGNAFQSHLPGQALCCRASENEFYILVPDMEQSQAEELPNVISQYLKDYASLHQLDCPIVLQSRFICGIYAAMPELEELLNQVKLS